MAETNLRNPWIVKQFLDRLTSAFYHRRLHFAARHSVVQGEAERGP